MFLSIDYILYNYDCVFRFIYLFLMSHQLINHCAHRTYHYQIILRLISVFIIWTNFSEIKLEIRIYKRIKINFTIRAKYKLYCLSIWVIIRAVYENRDSKYNHYQNILVTNNATTNISRYKISNLSIMS